MAGKNLFPYTTGNESRRARGNLAIRRGSEWETKECSDFQSFFCPITLFIGAFTLFIVYGGNFPCFVKEFLDKFREEATNNCCNLQLLCRCREKKGRSILIVFIKTT
jgi:hypothetical protein